MTQATNDSARPVGPTRRGIYLGALALAINAALPSSDGVVMAQSVKSARPITLVALGDSLTAGYQLAGPDAYPAQLEKALRAKGHTVTVVNAGVSGDTTATGLDRLGWAVPADADGVIVALGANDMLRGLDPARARDNLDKIVTAVTGQKQEVLLVGMLASTSLPPDYRRAFDAIYPDLAAKHRALLYPFFLDGIALDAKLNLKDGIHPNARGVAVMVERSLPKVQDLIARIAAKRGG